MPLFAADIAAEQPTPEERIEQFDTGWLQSQIGHRQLRAKHWREARQQLRAYDLDEQARIINAWNSKTCPADPANFLSFLRYWPRGKAELGEELQPEELQTLVIVNRAGQILALDLPNDVARLAAFKLSQRGLIGKTYVGNLVAWLKVR